MFKQNNKKIVPIRASPSPSGSGSFYQGLPKVDMPLHDADPAGVPDDHDEFERQMQIEMDLFGEDMQAHAEPVAARMASMEEEPGQGQGQ